MNIVEYLCRVSRKITESSLKEVKEPEYWIETEEERRLKFIDMLGLTNYIKVEERPPVEVKVTGTIEREDYTIKKLHYQSLPKLYVTGNLYIPKNLDKPAPAVLYLSGHSPNQKHHYQPHPKRFAQLGFVSLIIETIQRGEIPGYHHGTYRFGWFNWYSLGYTPAGVEVWNGIRALDLLQSLPEVDGEKIGVTGISGGGAMSWFLTAVDARVKVVAPVCGTATIASHICKRTIEGHCDCMFWINTYLWDLTDVGALIAPRPLLIASAKHDWIFDIESVRLIYNKLRLLYEALDHPDRIALVETPGGHSYHEKSRRMIFKWFLKHLKGMDIPLEKVGDIDKRPEVQETLETLRVFDKVPSDEKTTTVQEWFIQRAEPPQINNQEELEAYRRELIKKLCEKTFNAFPKQPCNLDVEVELRQEADGRLGYLMSFTPEEGWRLHMRVIRPIKSDEPIPTIMFLARSARNLTFGDELLRGFDGSWARAFVEVRGVGETSWTQDLQWFIRRSAMLTGRTIASMRVYDTLRALEVLEKLEWVDRSRIALMGSGEMAVVVLYTALLRRGLRAIVLHDPPSTQNMPSNPDGTGPAIEMLNCLRYTDLPYIAGLLWPAQLVFLGPRPKNYLWAENLYNRLGSPGVIRRFREISNWSL